jgi:hypothetical protein
LWALSTPRKPGEDRPPLIDFRERGRRFFDLRGAANQFLLLFYYCFVLHPYSNLGLWLHTNSSRFDNIFNIIQGGMERHCKAVGHDEMYVIVFMGNSNHVIRIKNYMGDFDKHGALLYRSFFIREASIPIDRLSISLLPKTAVAA